MKYFFDTYALIEIALQNKKFEQFVDEDAVTLKTNLAEMYFFLLKKFNQRTADHFLHQFGSCAVDFPLEIIAPAMLFKSKQEKHFSYIDCLGYSYALFFGRTFLTGDRAFESMEQVEIVR